VYVQNVTLENLRIIRGDSLYQPLNTSFNSSRVSSTPQSNGYALFVSHNYMSPSIGLRLLGLTKLTGSSFVLHYTILYCIILYFIKIYYAFFYIHFIRFEPHLTHMNEVIQDIESVFPVSLQRSLQVTFCLRTTTCCATTNIYWFDILADVVLQHVRFNKDFVADVKPCESPPSATPSQ